MTKSELSNFNLFLPLASRCLICPPSSPPPPPPPPAPAPAPAPAPRFFSPSPLGLPISHLEPIVAVSVEDVCTRCSQRRCHVHLRDRRRAGQSVFSFISSHAHFGPSDLLEQLERKREKKEQSTWLLSLVTSAFLVVLVLFSLSPFILFASLRFT
eukprot:767474-Hanusia_phi.AAC.2